MAVQPCMGWIPIFLKKTPYLFEGLGSLHTRFSAKFEKYALKSLAISLTSKLIVLSFSRQLILEIELSNFRPKIFKQFHNSLGFPMFSVSLLSR